MSWGLGSLKFEGFEQCCRIFFGRDVKSTKHERNKKSDEAIKGKIKT